MNTLTLLTVDGVNKKGTGFIATDGNWYNQDMKARPDFSFLKKGMVVEVDLNDNWVRSLKLADGNSPNIESYSDALKKPISGPKSQPQNHDKDAMIARHKAAEVVFMGELLDKSASSEEKFETAKVFLPAIEKYILTGGF